MADNIQVIRNTSVFNKTVSVNTKEVCYQALDSNVEEYHLVLEENSSLELLTFNKGSNPCKLNASVAKNASLTIYNMVISGKNQVLEENIYLNKHSARAKVLNVCLGYDNAEVHSLIHIFHNNEYTNSELETYAIALDDAVLTLDNNATIKQGCHKSIVHQKAKGLNLSPKSTIKAEPNLYIDEFDVEASHSASVGNINKDELFYLMSRGLKEGDARKIVVLGFINPLVDQISDSYDEEIQNIKKGLLEEFSQKLK